MVEFVFLVVVDLVVVAVLVPLKVRTVGKNITTGRGGGVVRPSVVVTGGPYCTGNGRFDDFDVLFPRAILGLS